MLDKQTILAENDRRNKERNRLYNPATGLNFFGERICVCIEELGELHLPKTMLKGWVKKLVKAGSFEKFCYQNYDEYDDDTIEQLIRSFIKERCTHDFEFWAVFAIIIKDKLTGKDIAFRLRRPQRKVLAELERMRLAGVPISLILLKARQWGGSTLIQFYMLWLQMMHRKQWSSVICGDVEGQSRNVRAMITKALKHYPAFLNDDITPKFSPFEGSNKNRIVKGRDCVVSIGSAQKPESLRSSDVSMAHLTEVGLWKTTQEKSPEDLIQSIVGTLNAGPYTLKALESTAKGVGNYFHVEWNRSVQGKSDSFPIFVAWFEIELYESPVTDIDELLAAMEESQGKEVDYMYLFELGATLENIVWYMAKLVAMKDIWRMRSEYPSTADEAFQSSGSRRFRKQDTIRLLKSCREAEFVGELEGKSFTGKDSLQDIRFIQDIHGSLKIWRKPDKKRTIEDQYIIIVDVGGTSDKADYSDILVLDRGLMLEGGIPEVVAEYHGHIDHDKLAWYAARLATWYQEGLLVIESNTLETDQTEGDHFEYILDELSREYMNLYSRTSEEQIKQGAPKRWGFHTNTSTKPMVINHQHVMIRDSLYIERSQEAVFEHDTYEIKPNGTLGAVDGCHDDRLMTRAIGNYIAYNAHIEYIGQRKGTRKITLINESSF